MELYWPTNKWWAATVIAVAGVLTTWLIAPDQEWTRVQTAALVAVVVQRVVAWLVPNKTDEEKSNEFEAPVPEIVPLVTPDTMDEVAGHVTP